MVGQAKKDILQIALCVGIKLPQRQMITIKKSNSWNSKNLTKLCKDCYIKVLEFIGISDVNLY